jgi:hypothetical protein
MKTTDTVGRRYRIVNEADEGFFRYDRLGDLLEQSNLQGSFLQPGQTLEYGTVYTPLHVQVKLRGNKAGQGDVNGFIPRPFLRQSPQVNSLAKTLVLPEDTWTTDTVQHNYVFTPGDRYLVPASGETQAYYPLTYWDIVPSADGLFWEMQQKETGDSTTGYRFSKVAVGWPLSELPKCKVSPTDTWVDQDEGTWQGVCPNPFFVAGFRHQAIGEEGQSYLLTQMQAGTLSYEYATQIIWGDETWMLWIPWRGKPKLFRNAAYHSWEPYWHFLYPTQWEECAWTGGDLKEIDPETAANKGYTYHIGVVKGCLCVWEGSWDGNCAYYDASGQGEPVVPTGRLYMQNYPGQCTYWLDLVQAPLQMEIGRRKFWVGAHGDPNALVQTLEGQVWGGPGDVMRNLNGLEPDETVSLPDLVAGSNKCDLDIYCDPETPEYLHYVLTFSPGYHYTIWREGTTGMLANLKTYTLPFVDAVSIWQPTTLTDGGAVAYTVAQETVPQAWVFEDELKESKAQTQSFKVYNGQPGFLPDNLPEEYEAEPTEGLPRSYRMKPGAQVKLSLTWRMFDTVTGVLSWADLVECGEYTVLRAEPGKMETEVDATCLWGLAALAQWSTGELNFRGWFVKDALEFLCDLLAIGAAQRDFEDLGEGAQVLWTDDSASYKPGKKFAEIMVDLVRRYGQDSVLWYDRSDNKLKTGCKYCRAKRTTTDMGSGVLEWMTHKDNGWASSGCLIVDAIRSPADSIDYHLVDDPDATGVEEGNLYFSIKPVKATVSNLAREGYANEIVVVGRDATGKLPLEARWRNPDAFDLPDTDYVGVRVTKVIDNGTGQTQESLNDTLSDAVATALAWPLEVEAVLVLHPEVRVGYVMQVQGGKYAAVNQKKFRITGTRHDVKAQTTLVRGHEIKAAL